MDDFPDSTTATTAAVLPWGRVSGNIETAGDTDWFRITLQAGVSYRFDLGGSPSGGGSLSDPTLRLRDSAGSELRFNDDSAGTLDSQIVFFAQNSGTYFLEAGGFGGQSGTYLLSAVVASGPSITVRDGNQVLNNGWSVSFGSASQFQGNVDHAITIINDGDAPLRTAGLTAPAGFSIVDGLIATILPGQSDTVIIRMNTDTVGNKSGMVRFSTEDANDALFEIFVAGTVGGGGIGPEIAVFGNGREIFQGGGGITQFDNTAFMNTLPVHLGAVPAERVFTVHNNGSAPMSVSGISLPFQLVPVEGLATEIAPGASDTFTVQIAPFVPTGLWSGTISIQTNDADESSFNFTVNGQILFSANEPDINVRALQAVPRTIINGDTQAFVENGTSFGTVPLGQMVAPHVFEVRNDGASNLRIDFLSAPASFNVGAGGFRNNLSPGESFTFTLTLDTSVIGPQSGFVSIGSNDSDESNFQFFVSGTVDSAPADDFPILGPGTTGIVQAGGPGVSGSLETLEDADWFRVDLSAGTAYAIEATGQPGIGGTLFDGYLVLHDQSGNQLLSLDDDSRGTGGDPRIVYYAQSSGPYLVEVKAFSSQTGGYQLQVAPTTTPEITVFTDGQYLRTFQSVTFGSVPQGQADVQRVFSVRNDGGAPLNLGSVVLPAGFTLAEGLSPVLAPGQIDAFTVQVDTASAVQRTGLLSFTTNDPNEGSFFANLAATVSPAPDVTVLGNNQVINDGDTTPALQDHTVFADSAQGGAGATRVFTVRNEGSLDLTTDALSVPAGFTIVEGLSGLIGVGQSDTFTVGVLTASAGAYGGDITFTSNDVDETPFNFAITAVVGASTALSVLGNGISITDGDTTPSPADATDFGSVTQGTSPVSRVFTIRNDGTAALTVTGITVPTGFSLPFVFQSVTVTSTFSFNVLLDVNPAGTKSGEVVITSDGAPSPFNFAISGTVNTPPEITVLGNNTSIADGDLTPSGADFTDFGSASQGGAAVDRVFTVRNDGQTPLTTGALTLPAGFTLVDALNATINPGQSDTFTVRLDTSSAGTKSGQVSFTNSDADESPFDFAITGIVTAPAAPDIVVRFNAQNIADGDTTPSALEGTDFGIGTPDVAGASIRTFTVRNDGNATLNITGISLPFGFAIDEPLTASLAPNASDTFTVRFFDGGTGFQWTGSLSVSGDIVITSNDPDENPFNFTVSGQVPEPPEVAVQGNAQNIADGDLTPVTSDHTDFGSAVQGALGVERTFTVQNTGGAALSTSGFQLPSGFSLVEPLSASIGAGASDTFTVRLDTATAGVKSGQISFATNDLDEPVFNFAIAGTVNAPTFPEVTVLGNGQSIADGDLTPSAADHTDFGSVLQGSAFVDRTFTIRNDGGTPLTTSGLSVSGAGFTVIDTLNGSIASGGSDTIVIRMDTSQAGTKTGQVTFNNNDGDENPFNFTITGLVQPPATPDITVRGNNQNIVDGDGSPSLGDHTDFGTAQLGSGSVDRVFTVRNDGTGTLTLGSVTLPAGFTLVEPLSASLAPNASDTFTVRLDTSAVALRSGEIVIATNDGDENPFNFSVTGTVVPSTTDDYPLVGLATTGQITVGSPVTGAIERAGDTDWFRVTLTAGTSYTFDVDGAGSGLASLSNPYLVLRDATSALLDQDNDSGLGIDAQVVFTATANAVHLLEVKGASGIDSGSYRLRASVTAGPEVSVRGNGQPVPDDSASAGAGNGTDFGVVAAGGPSVERTFTVRNDGTSALTLSALSVPAGFEIGEGLTGSLAPGASDTFTVRMPTTVSGVRSGQVRFTTNDPSETAYDFTVAGTVTPQNAPPEVAVTGNTVNIADGDSTPFANDHTDFGTVALGSSGVQRVFTVRNDGGSPLVIGGLTVPVGFSVLETLSATIAPGQSDIFTVRMDTGFGGPHAGQVVFTTNDTDENPFNFSIAGSVTPPRTTLAAGPQVRPGVQFTGFDFSEAINLPGRSGGTDLMLASAADSFRVRVESTREFLFRGSFTTVASGLPDGTVTDIEVSAVGGQTLFSISGLRDPASGALGVSMARYKELAAANSFGALLDYLLSGPNTINGHASAADNLRGAAGDDTLSGLGGNDDLLGERGNDVLIGGDGADTMRGGLGNDTYNLGGADTIIELSGEGVDTVESAVTFTLPSQVENLTLSGTSATNGTGNELNNVLVGNAGLNTLTGLAGNDRYIIQNVGDRVVEGPNEGRDTVVTPLAIDGSGTAIGASLSILVLAGLNIENVVLTGSANIDVIGTPEPNLLVGNAGANVLTGGAGDDTYQIQAGDTVVEAVNGGTDTVDSTASFNLVGTNVEHLTLRGGANLTGTGDAGANTLIGNRGNNTVFGGSGNDTLIGGPGFDTAGYSGLQSSYTVTRSGAEVTVNGPEGTDKLVGMERIAFGDTTMVLPVVGRAAGTDLNADGKGDLIWRHESGQVVAWLVDGITVPGGADLGLRAPMEWRVVAVKDLSGDAKADIVWRHDNGTVAVWLLDGTTVSGGAGLGPQPGTAEWLGTDWRIEGLADFNADRKSDILWRNDDGRLAVWLLDGLSVTTQTTLGEVVPSDSGLAGMVDFTGDGKSDLLWRKDTGEVEVWAMDGASVLAKGQIGPVLGDEWSIAASTDFNSDGKNDLLWRRNDGQIDVWLLDGTNAPAVGTLPYLAPAGWNLEVINDLNADGKTDLLWRHDSGPIAIWLVDGTDVPVGAGFQYQAPLGWNVAAVTDFNGDQRNDVLWRHDSGPVVAWFIDGTQFVGGGQLPYNAPTEWLAT